MLSSGISAEPAPRKSDAARLIYGTLARALKPDPIMSVAEWADAYRHVSQEASPFPGPWRTSLVPYLREVMDCLSPSHPCREVTFKKSAQVAGTEAGVNLFGFIAHMAPGPMLIVLPTVDEGKKYVRVKLQPAIDATPVLKKRIREQKSRDEKGSTTAFKKFPGGYAQITGANSSAGLQMISVRYIIKEELSEWPFDVDGRGDPDKLADKRATAFSRNCKKFNNSTPGIKGMCRISNKYEASDQRWYFVPCPHCGEKQNLIWDRMRFDKDKPDAAFYECIVNGCVIEHQHKLWMIDTAHGAEWRAQAPGPGREPGFQINQLYSPFVSWSDTVREYLNSRGDPVAEKVFDQQVLGEAYEEKGESPDHLKLFARREEFALGAIPPGGLFLTAGIDVQGNRIEWSVWAWGIGKQRWLVDFGIVEGDTGDDATWVRMNPVVDRQYPNVQGRMLQIEMAAVDTGFNTQAVYRWARGKQRVIAIKGMPGHLSPALGTPTRQDVDFQGRRVKGGIMLWPVGTWTLKAELYANLRKTIEGPDADGQFLPGYVHLPVSVDEPRLQQLTAEYLATQEKRGVIVKEWVKPAGRANEELDKAVYAAAAAVHLGIDKISPARWRELAIERGAEPEQAQMQLAIWHGLAPKGTTPQQAAEAMAAVAAKGKRRRRVRGQVEQ